MFSTIRQLFVSRKFLLGVGVIALIFLGGWYVNGLRQENHALNSRVEDLQIENAQITDDLRDQVETLETTIDSYDEMMSTYINATFASDQMNQRLKYTLEQLNNEDLRACMRTRVDAEFLDGVFNYPTNPRQDR